MVALARKLLIALWRFVIDGVMPEGAVMKPCRLIVSAIRAALRTHCGPAIRGNVAVVRHGASAPSSKSGAVLLELSRPECGTVVGITIPPDVRLAGKPCSNESSALDRRWQKALTGESSCEAEHMAAPTKPAT